MIGNNIGNEITTASCTHTNFAGGVSTTGVITGGTVRGPAGVAETMCQTRRGREVWVRLTFRPAGLFGK